MTEIAVPHELRQVPTAEYRIILELKAMEHIREEHIAQLTNYLKATKKKVGLLLNFGTKPEFKRIVFTNSYKKTV